MTTTPTTPTKPTAPAGSPGRRSWSATRTVLVVAGSVPALLGVGSLAGGGFALWAAQQRDSDGYLTSGQAHFTTKQCRSFEPQLSSRSCSRDGPARWSWTPRWSTACPRDSRSPTR